MSIDDKITRVTFGRGSLQEGADVTAHINDLRELIDEAIAWWDHRGTMPWDTWLRRAKKLRGVSSEDSDRG